MVRFLLVNYIDIYISMVSSSHAVCAKGLFIAMISTTVETDKPELEIRPALDLLGDILEMFVQVQAFYDPIDDGKKDQVIFFNLIFSVVRHQKLRCYFPFRKR